MIPFPPIHIVGAGIAGLTLARCLKNKGIQAVIFEKNPSPPKHNYGITLQPRTCWALMKVLDTDPRSFCYRVAVDSAVGGCGHVGLKDRVRSDIGGISSPFRAHCGRLEAFLREELKIEWGYMLEGVSEQGDEHVLEFKGQDKVHDAFIIDTSGVHSRIRQALLPKSELSILPYVVFRGTRNIYGRTFRDIYQLFSEGRNVIGTRRDHTLFQVWINQYQKDAGAVDISYVYSRPAREDDPLYRPGRAPGESSDSSQAFFEEVSQLCELEQPFKNAFDGEKIKEDRILHWLMRTSLTPLDKLIELSKRGVAFLGDSAHVMPILGGEGANFAIDDAVALAECIAANGAARMEDFYEERYGEWEGGVRDSGKRLREMHSVTKSVL